MNCLELARQVLDVEADAIRVVRDGLDESFAHAVAHLLACSDRGGKVLVSGVGKNLSIADKISGTFSSTGTRSVVLNPVQAMHGDIGMVAEDDALIALSYSGESEEVLSVVRMVRRLGIGVVSITGQADSALAQCSDFVILARVPKEACPFNLAPTASTTAALAVGDALAMALLDARGFKREDYARLHPAGAIGRALLLLVSDIMRPAERYAAVRLGTPVRETLLAMTQFRCGSAAVVDADGRLTGIFTDGDLRRRLGEGFNILDMRIETVMTSNPISIRRDIPAIEALHVFETHKIDDLPVVDSDGRFVGSVDIQDLPRFKVM